MNDKRFRELVLEAVEDDLVEGEDGYQVLWPKSYKRAFGSKALRIIAKELDRRNQGWEKRVLEDLRARAREKPTTPGTEGF